MKKRYYIPMNFMETGYLMNGAIPVRNVVEAVVLFLVGHCVTKLFPLPEGTDAITPYILIVAPFVLIGLSGVQGDPLSIFLVDFFKWRGHRKPYFYSTHNEAYTQEAADKLLDEPQFRDMIADLFDSLRKKMTPKSIDYVEGETFEFASDPEQEALREAQKEIITKREEEAARILEELQKQTEEQTEQQEEQKPEEFAAQTDDAMQIDAGQIAQMLVLEDIELEVSLDDLEEEV